jgi:hypothetical protein
MILKNLRILILLLFLLSCTKTGDIPETFVISGDYSGTFCRTNIKTGWCCNSEVILSLTDSTFTGSGEQQYFPAICSGNYELTENKIFFQNKCVWPAHFDWSLILSEDWNYELYGNQLRIWKERGNIEDEYLLKKG